MQKSSPNLELARPDVPEMGEIPPGYLKLWERHGQSPVEEGLWEEVIALAYSEESTSRAQSGIYAQIPLDALVALSERVRTESNLTARYKLLTEPSPTGEIWFNVLVGLSSQEVVEAIGEEVGQQAWSRGLDLGAATGNLSEAIRPHCKSLVSLDLSRPLLEIARQRADGRGVYLQADTLKLPLETEQFDLVASSGLTQPFNHGQLEAFADELHRVLTSGGVYIEGFLHAREGRLHAHERKSLTNAKGILADMIVDEVSGSAKMSTNQQVSLPEFVKIFQKRGFEVSLRPYPDKEVILIIFTKK